MAEINGCRACGHHWPAKWKIREGDRCPRRSSLPNSIRHATRPHRPQGEQDRPSNAATSEAVPCQEGSRFCRAGQWQQTSLRTGRSCYRRSRLSDLPRPIYPYSGTLRYVARVLRCNLELGAIREVIEEKAKTTSGIWKINQGHILSIAIPVPPLPEQRRIVAHLDELKEKTDALKALQAETSADLDALMPSILDKAFRGEL